MKRTFTGLFLIIFLGFFMITPVTATPIAQLNLLNTPVDVGDTFQLEVWANGDEIGLDLVSFGFDVSFGVEGIYSYEGFTLGSGFDDDSFGDGNVAGSAFPGIMEDNYLLATLSFKTLSIGTDTINVIGLYDGGFSGLYYELPDLSLTGYDINVSRVVETGAAPVPEPTTLLLVGAGLVGIAGRRKKMMK